VRARGVIAVSLLFVGLTTQAEAKTAPKVPAPTSSIATYIAGAKSPQPLITGGWGSPDRDSNEWIAGGTGLTGTSTVIDATWTSPWRWADGRHADLFVRAEAEHTSYVPGLADTTWSYTLQERTLHGGWVSERVEEVQPYDPQFIEDSIFTDLDRTDARVRVQYRVLFHAEVQGTYRESFALDVVALGTP